MMSGLYSQLQCEVAMKQDQGFPIVGFRLPLTCFGRDAKLRLPSVGHMTDQLTTISNESVDISVTLSTQPSTDTDVAAARRVMQGRAGT